MTTDRAVAQGGQHISLDNAAPKNAMVEIESSKAIQEVQAALIIAKRFPRDENEAAMAIINSCLRPALADEGLYQYARGGTDIAGASIRLAEVMARSWGNLCYGWRELERKGNVSTVQAYCWDQQTNTKAELVFDVKHIRNTKKGSYPLTDERDIYENMANNAARRLRKCILSIIPGDIVDAAVDRCEKTIAEQVTPDKVEALVRAFAGFNVNVAMIEARIQKKLDAIGGRQVVDLRRVYNSLRDGMSAPSQWFDVKMADKPAAAAAEPTTKLDAFKEKNAMPERQIGDEPDEESQGDPEPEDNIPTTWPTTDKPA